MSEAEVTTQETAVAPKKPAEVADIVKAGTETEQPAIVKNASKAYGYNYASLADIVKAGFKIPQMRVKPTDLGEYIEYLDESGEWQLGSKIVIPEMKGSNAAQTYGSALTYARRYTVQMALGIACDDDKKLEAQPPKKDYQAQPQGDKARQQGHKIDFALLKEIRVEITKCQTVKQLVAYQAKINLDDAHWNMVKRDFSKRKEQLLAAIPEAEEVEDGAN